VVKKGIYLIQAMVHPRLKMENDCLSVHLDGDLIFGRDYD